MSGYPSLSGAGPFSPSSSSSSSGSGTSPFASLEEFHINPNDVVREEKIGEGGMGIVYKGSYNLEQVAIKEVRFPGTNESKEVADLTRELLAQIKLRSSYVARVLGCCLTGESKFIVTELCASDLAAYVEAETVSGSLSPSAVVGFLIAAVRGLHAVHKAGIVHRDIKAQNVLIKNFKSGEACLSDFGLAKHGEDKNSLSKAGAVGTLFFEAPEVIHGLASNRASDMYSFGIMMCEVALGGTAELYKNLSNRMLSSYVLDGLRPDQWSKESEAKYIKDRQRIRADVPRFEPKPINEKVWSKEYVELVHDLYQDDPTKRPETTMTHTRLMAIKAILDGAAGEKNIAAAEKAAAEKAAAETAAADKAAAEKAVAERAAAEKAAADKAAAERAATEKAEMCRLENEMKAQEEVKKREQERAQLQTEADRLEKEKKAKEEEEKKQKILENEKKQQGESEAYHPGKIGYGYADGDDAYASWDEYKRAYDAYGADDAAAYYDGAKWSCCGGIHDSKPCSTRPKPSHT